MTTERPKHRVNRYVEIRPKTPGRGFLLRKASDPPDPNAFEEWKLPVGTFVPDTTDNPDLVLGYTREEIEAGLIPTFIFPPVTPPTSGDGERYTCAACGRTFLRSRTDEEVLLEAATFGMRPDPGGRLICDECWKTIPHGAPAGEN